MTDTVLEIGDVRVLVCSAEGAPIVSERDAGDLMGEAWGQRVAMMAIPVERLGDSFFDLSTRLAGAILQKFVNYRLRVAIVGDMSAWIASSGALRDFVYESNQGRSVWFVADLEQLSERLSSLG